MRVALGESCSPAPISARAGACSRIVEAMPTLASASALARPAMPAPAIRTGASRVMVQAARVATLIDAVASTLPSVTASGR